MTDIPGTGSARKPKTQVSPTLQIKIPEQPKEEAVLPMSVTNIEEIKKSREKKAQTPNPTIVRTPKPEPTNPEVWYQTLYAWMGFGTTLGVLFAIIGIIYPQFFTLAPVAPTLGVVAWYVRRFIQKHERKMDVWS